MSLKMGSILRWPSRLSVAFVLIALGFVWRRVKGNIYTGAHAFFISPAVGAGLKANSRAETAGQTLALVEVPTPPRSKHLRHAVDECRGKCGGNERPLNFINSVMSQ